MDNLQALAKMLEMVDTKSNMDDFVKAFSLVVDHIKTFQDSTTTDIAEIFRQLEEFAGKLKTDNEEDRSVVKSMVGEAIASLRVSLDADSASQASKIDARLAEIKDGAPGKDGVGKDGRDGLNGKDGSPDGPDEIIQKVNRSSLLIAKERVEGLVDYIRMAASNAVGSMPVTTSFFNGLRGKNLNIVGGTATQNGDTVNITVSGSGGSGTVTEVDTGTGLTGGPITTTGTIALDSKLAPLDTLGTAGQVVRVNAEATALEYFTAGGGSGTVTSVASADGSVTVTNPTTTPDLAVVSAPKLTTARNIDGQAFDGTAAITVIAPGTHAATSKATPVDADEIPLVDSAASNVLKKLTWANLKATLKTYFDTLYGAGTVTAVSIATANGFSGSSSGGATPALTIVAGNITPTGITVPAGTNFILQDPTDPTKQAEFDASVIATGTTRTFTLPNKTGTLATLNGTQTWTGTQTFNSGVLAATSPTFTTPALGTPASGVATNLTGTATALNIGGNAATVTTNANLTGPITSSGNATAIANSIALPASPTTTTQAPADNSTKIATTAYVDNAVLGQRQKEAVKYASIAALPSIVYANGSSGVGATLTGVALAAISLDSSSPSVNDRVLIKNQASDFQNGIYTVTATGSGIAVFVLTRATDFDQASDIQTGDSVFVTAGNTLANTTWTYNGIDSPTMGTTSLTFVQAAGPGSYTAGNGIAITGTSIAIDTSVTVDKTTAQTLTNKTLTSPILTTPALGTPASGVATNLTGTATALNIGGNAATVTTNANLTGAVTSSGNATSLGSFSSANLSGALTDETGSGAAVFGTTPTISTPVINGLATGTGVDSAATVSTLAARDANGNLSAVSHIDGFTTTATAAGTTTLTIGSTKTQVFTGSTTQTVKLPTTGVVAGQQYLIINDSTGLVTVQSSGANTIIIVAGSTYGLFTAIVATPTTAANWDWQYGGYLVTSGKRLSVSNSLTLAGTDATTMTFPSTSATVARTDAANTFTGHQTIEGVTSTGATGTGKFVFDGSPTLVTPTIGAATATSLTAAANTSINMIAGTYNTIQTYTPSAAGTATLDLSKGNIHHITMPAGNITIALSNTTAGQCFIIRILQDGTGSRTVTWFTTIKWAGGSAPTLTTTASKADTLGFEVTTAGSAYDGFIVGQNI